MRDLLQRRNYVLRYLGACPEQPPAWGSGSSTRSSNNAHASSTRSNNISFDLCRRSPCRRAGVSGDCHERLADC